MDGKKWLIVLFLLIGFKGFGQSYQYTYVDPCTGIPNTVTITQPSGSVTLFYAGQYQTFTAAQLQAGGYEAWVASINAAAPPGSNPCAGNAGAVSSSTSASVGTNISNTVSNISGALATLGSTTSGGSSGGGMGMSTTSGSSSLGSSSSSSSSDGGSSSSDDGGDSGDGSSSTNSGSSSSSSGNTSGSSSGNSSGGSTGGNSGSGDTGGNTGGSSGGGDTGGSSGGGDTGGSSGGNSGGGDTGGGSSGGGDTGGSSGGGTGGGASEGGQSAGGGSSTDGGSDEGSSNGGAIGDKDIESESGGQSESESEDSGGGGGKKKKSGGRARKGSLIASGDIVLIRNGSDYKQSGNDNFKINAGVTYANTKQTLSIGTLLNYTTGQNEFSFTGYGSFKIEESMIVGSNSFLYNVSQQTWFNTGNVMYAYKQSKYLTTLMGTNFSFGQLGEENFSNWSANIGTFTTFSGYRGFAMNLMGIAMYSPYTFFYEGQWFKGGFLFVPLTSFDFNVTNTFKFNVSTSTVYLMGEGILNFQLMTGTKMLL